MNPIKKLCTSEAGKATVLQGNIAFAVGCVRSGIHAVDGYPGTPSTEVIDKGLSNVQDLIEVGWSVSEATAVAVAHGHSMAGNDCVVTMKIPGLFQAGDLLTSSAFFTEERGALVYYVAADFTPSSTQHLVDPRPLIRSSFIPVFEPRNHQELHIASEIAANISREYRTPCVILVSGTLCHSEGLVRLTEQKTRERAAVTVPLSEFNTLPVVARKNYDLVVTERWPALKTMAEQSPLNVWEKGAGKVGIITCGAGDIMVREVRQSLGKDFDILSLGLTVPLPMERIREFHAAIDGPVYVVEDGYRYLQEAIEREGLAVVGKAETDTRTEWDPASVSALLGYPLEETLVHGVEPLKRPPMICAGCPYRLFGETVRQMKKKGEIEASFGDIGCNTLLHFMDAVDTGLAMGASEGNRMGYVLANPDKAAKCISVLGDGTECHSGLDATRNTLFRNVPGVKVILDNNWTAMTGGQPGPTSPVNLAGHENSFDLQKTLAAHGAQVIEASGYDRKAIRRGLTEALANAEKGEFTTLVVTGSCIRKVPKSAYGTKMTVNADICKRCGLCQICPGIQADKDGLPSFNNLCTGCVSQAAACAQMCPVKAISVAEPSETETSARVTLPDAPETLILPEKSALSLPERLAVAIRGVGGQGNLFFGRVLTQLAFLAGYDDTNVVKGETHGMAQMGGPVVSTFSCGAAISPTLLPGTADCLVSMEKSEVLRPGFLNTLRPGGMVLLADTEVLPHGVDEAMYPSTEAITDALAGYNVVIVDVLKAALELGDATGRIANVVMMGALSTLSPFDAFPEEFWFQALKNVSPKPAIWNANYAAFNAGKKLL
ncbi:pyruvate ferredoxin oxidoreductase [Pseudodesulfovibrio sp. JC047]|uniref:2-oxoacid:acceptor oxidoreductase family protein n=1 Tax=Pseudodesulfovibrio sp. JC047 TaxID=2683199 RepID=UPI0013D4257F|nr:2-oxoacid:acceptor oxidoreductase family protein [Pseudodesulfovibrio sp. JC047]NDV18202.1 pyruvate ferredoxin oxidoreductase [Pseudodesulfovibrio sp. JC047]